VDTSPDTRDLIVQEIADAIREVLKKRIRLEAMEMHLMPIECAQAVYETIKPRLGDLS